MKSNPSIPLHIDPQADLPIFAQLKQQITWLLASGRLEPGSRLPNIRDMADQLGVNLHTIRQAYHDLELDGLVETKPGRGTRLMAFDPKAVSANNPSRSSNALGVLVPNPHPFYAAILRGIEEIAYPSSRFLMICYTHDDEQLTLKLTHQLIAKNVAGLIVASPVAGIPNGEEKTLGLPVVYVDAPQVKENVVLHDLEGAGYQATKHLIDHDHRRIGLISAPISWPNFSESYRGYVRALKESKLEFGPNLIIEAPAVVQETGYEAASRLLDHTAPPSAIFVTSDLLAAGAIRLIKDRGLRVPQDIAIVSKDNIDFADLLDPPLTTVASPSYQMGQAAMEMLSQLIMGKRLNSKRIIMPTELVVRKSCGCNAEFTHLN